MKSKLLTFFVTSALASIAVLNVSNAWAADGDKFTFATGFDYSSGKYGTSDTTDILSIPIVGMYQTSSWVLKLTVPYVRITGVGDVVLGGKRIKAPTTTTTTKSTTQSGLGDVIAAATYNVYSGSENNFGVDVTGRVKFGTASTTLGTGENDYAAQVGVYKRSGSFTSMMALGYEALGSPTGVDLNNMTYGTLAGDYKFTDQTNGGVEMRVSEKPSTIGAVQQELTIYVNHRIDNSFNIRGYALKGFSDGSADNGFGMMVSSEF